MYLNIRVFFIISILFKNKIPWRFRRCAFLPMENHVPVDTAANH